MAINNKTQEEFKLAEAEETFRLLVNSVTDYAIFALDTHGNVLTWNAGAARLKGYTPAEIIGRNISAFYTPEDNARSHPQRELEIATFTGKYEEEGWRVKKDGTRFWANVLITKLVDKNKKHIGFAKVTRDLTERKLHEENLKSSEEKLRLMIQSVKDYAIFMLDPNGLVTSWNEGAERNKLYRASEIIGQHFRKFYSYEEREKKIPEQELEVAARVGRFEDTGWRFRKDGSQFWANVVISSIRDSKGNLLGFTKVTRDLTSQKLADEKLKTNYSALETAVHERTRELLEAKQAAEKASEIKSTFLANMSHEIRTPLGAIMGFTDLMGNQDMPREEINSYLAVIKRNSTLLLRIIDDILDLSKVEAGRMDIEHIRFSLPQLLADTASMLGLRARENSIRFNLKALTPIPDIVISDPTRLRQIINNVVGNAIKFTEKGSVEVSISAKNGELIFVVKDSGRGISQEQADKLFKPFTQADASTSRKYGGTGLGLSLTKALCQAMGGDFYLEESSLGAGSTFVASIKIEIPNDSKLVTDVNSKLAGEPILPKADGKILQNMKILLVEDSPDNQNLIQIVLSRAGAISDVASDGLEGVKMAMAGDYDAVLMDIQMPYMDGLEAVGLLRSKKYAKPVIALTAHAMKEHKAQALDAGFTAYLSKPIQRDQMIEVLRQIHEAAR